ncbi:helix-turn-helix domain-containing protein [Herbaspirillum sp. GCM10030257]|uniref:helix-turn-helix domain-containing protein n=1 Tax=Herbaspirillum sp. GCM10030257 TaxID=3273393 RepID=UPI003620DEC6
MAIALRNRLEIWQQRESGMLAVIESARDLSSRLDLPELLRALVTRARTMLGSHVSWLTEYDEANDTFQVLAADGTHMLAAGQSVSGRDTGIVGLVASTRRPFTTPDYLHDTRFTHHPLLDATFREEGVHSIVGVPLLWEDAVIGLLFVGDRHHRTHTAQGISVLSTLATHAAVAIKNARTFAQASTALRALEEHARQVQSAAEAHERMTSLLARGAKLSTICKEVADMLDGAVLVLDEAAQPIGRGIPASCNGAAAADSYAPHGVQSAPLAQALRQSRQVGRSVVVWEIDGESCRVNAVIGGDDMLGSILLFRQGGLDDHAVRNFERSATILGVVLLSRERMEASRTRDEAALLRSLLFPRQEGQALVAERTERFGISLDEPMSLLVLETEDPDASYSARRLRAANVLGQVLFDDVDGAIVLLCSTRRVGDVRHAIVQYLQNHHHGGAWRGMLSRPATLVAELPALHAMLRRALPVLRRLGIVGHVMGQNEMALYSTLFETHDHASITNFLEATIGPLLAYDLKRATQLTVTLLTYFETHYNAALTAQRLGVHVNTIRHRFETIEDLLGPWGQPTRALELHVALRLWQVTASSNSPNKVDH